MALSPFMVALNQLCDEKGLSKEIVVSTVEAALAAAYRKDYGNPRMIVRAKLNEEDLTKTKMSRVFKIVEDQEFEDEENQIKLSDGKKEKKDIKVEDEILKPLPHHEDFGRIAAQTAKQVIIQRLQEAERNMLYDEFKDKEGFLLNSNVQQIEGSNVIINLGKANAIMPPNEQIPNERYHIGQRLKVYISSVEETSRGPKIIVSRSHPNLIKGLFALEVPEIGLNTVKIQAVSREAGSRSKVAVSAHQEGLDPVGSCVGQRGIRVQAVLAEIGNEKIDIILYDENPEQFIINALSPAKIGKLKINKKNNKAQVYVEDDQLSLAIGKGGQNVRLASKLTGWGLDIEKISDKKTKKADDKEKSDKDEKKEIKHKDEKSLKKESTKKPKDKKTTKKKSEKISGKETKDQKPKK